MARESMAAGWLQQPELAGRALAVAGVLREDELPLRIEKAWPFRARGLLARARTRSGSWCAFASIDVDDTMPRALEAGIADAGVREVAAHNVFAWRFHADPALVLGRHIDVDGAGGIGKPAASGQGIVRQEIRILGYKPLHRCVLRYSQSAIGPVITKLYAGKRDVRAAEAYAGIGPPNGPARVGIPCPESHDWPGRALHWRESPGDSMLQKLATDPRPGLMQCAADVIAHLRARRVTWTQRHTAADELNTVRRWVEFAASIRPDLQPQLAGAWDTLQAIEAQLLHGQQVPSHRDFYDKQLLVGAMETTLLDLDTACLADPELDLGNFLAHLQLRQLQGRLGNARELSAEFMRHVGRGPGKGLIDPVRLKFYESCARLRLACVYLARSQWRRVALSLLMSANNHHDQSRGG